jgi:hypothetical protein
MGFIKDGTSEHHRHQADVPSKDLMGSLNASQEARKTEARPQVIDAVSYFLIMHHFAIKGCSLCLWQLVLAVHMQLTIWFVTTDSLNILLLCERSGTICVFIINKL